MLPKCTSFFNDSMTHTPLDTPKLRTSIERAVLNVCISLF